ncbi:hypothetical protein ONE63_011073 [Megalurothrips usitatus]|uniref:Peptidase S1 domain-containing protein n=1 Tax=Megalurothrips usitatus TaxID=439358 RepID=A0AAV7XJ08_9NEOP|nr:hypothetical protein ONE63_011073 [Megalurothrips usitatus]
MSVPSIVVVLAALMACVHGLAVEPQRPSRVGVVGGHDAQPKQFPHMASIQAVVPGFWIFESSQHICGGTLIYKRWVLTTAHCLHTVPANAKRIEVVLGTESLSSWSSQRIGVAKTITHEKYDPSRNGGAGYFDIAMIKLASMAVLSDSVQLAALPMSSKAPTGSATFSGWGSTEGDRAVYPDRLQTVDLPLVLYTDCFDFITRSDPRHVNMLVESNLCAGSLTEPGVALCSLDDGSPLVQEDTDPKRTTVIGMASWGLQDCGSKPYPSVFIRVGSFLSWIDAVFVKH